MSLKFERIRAILLQTKQLSAKFCPRPLSQPFGGFRRLKNQYR